MRIGIVGGSISGVCAAVVLSRLGHQVTVFERTRSRLEDRGAALGCEIQAVDRWKAMDLLDQDLVGIRASTRTWCVKDGDARLGRVLHQHPMAIEQHSWGNVYHHLLRRAAAVTFERGVTVEGVTTAPAGATLHLTGTADRDFDIVIGADGYLSTVRDSAFPSVEPQYAGYVGWRGVVREEQLSDMGPVLDEMQSVGTPQGNALFLMMPGPGGSIEPGRRGVTFLWYEAYTPLEMLPVAVGRGGRTHAVSIAPGRMPPEILNHLNTMADEVLPPWHAEVVHASPDPFLQPIYDVLPDHYVNGRVCLLGDAASTARPHTGSGAAKGIGDAIALAEALTTESTVDAALERYDRERVAAGGAIVELGRAVGDDTILHAPDWNAIDPAAFTEWIEHGPQSRVYYHQHR